MCDPQANFESLQIDISLPQKCSLRVNLRGRRRILFSPPAQSSCGRMLTRCSRLRNLIGGPLNTSEQPARARCCQVQSSAEMRVLGLVNFIPALAYQFCLALPAALTQPGDHLLSERCKSPSHFTLSEREVWRGWRPTTISNSMKLAKELLYRKVGWELRE